MEENLKEKLFNTRENGWDTVDTRKKEAIFSFTKDYMNYLNRAKTERVLFYYLANISYIYTLEFTFRQRLKKKIEHHISI